jgi:hypothetical protein
LPDLAIAVFHLETTAHASSTNSVYYKLAAACEFPHSPVTTLVTADLTAPEHHKSPGDLDTLPFSLPPLLLGHSLHEDPCSASPKRETIVPIKDL